MPMDQSQQLALKELLGKMDVSDLLGLLSPEQRVATRTTLENYTLSPEERTERIESIQTTMKTLRGLYEELGMVTNVSEDDDGLPTKFTVKVKKPKLPALQAEEFETKIYPNLPKEFKRSHINAELAKLGWKKDVQKLMFKYARDGQDLFTKKEGKGLAGVNTTYVKKEEPKKKKEKDKTPF